MRKRFVLAPVGVAVFILYFTVFGERGLLRINHLHRDQDEMQKRYLEIKGENDRLKREITALQADRRYLESIARRDFGLVRPNEVVYQFTPKGGEKAPPKVEQKEEKQGAQGRQNPQAGRQVAPPSAEKR